jgi:hypothetical protein
MVGYKLFLKVLEVVLSAAFLFLCAKAFCSHFYKDLKTALRNRKQQIGFTEAAPSIVLPCQRPSQRKFAIPISDKTGLS